MQPEYRLLPRWGDTDLRIVNGQPMDEEEYRICGWHVVGTYESNGRTVQVWKATREGLEEYGRLKAQRRRERREAWRQREEAEEAYSAAVLREMDRRAGV